RRAGRAGADRYVVVDLHLGDGAGVECNVDGGGPVSVRSRRGRSLPDCHAIAIPLDLARRARLCAGNHARRLAAGRGVDANYRSAVDGGIRVARGIFCVRPDGTILGRGLVLVLSRHSARACERKRSRTESDPRFGCWGAHTQNAIRTLAANSSKLHAVDALGYVLLLRVLHFGLSRLVPEIPQRTPRLRP